MTVKEKKASIEERLKNHPLIKARMEALLDITDNVDGTLDRADDAEEQVIIEIQKMGREILQTWAATQEVKKSQEARANNKNALAHSKKNSTGTQHSAK